MSDTVLLTLAAVAVAFAFYVGVPGLGAISVRSGWRRFRRALVVASLYPTLRADPDDGAAAVLAAATAPPAASLGTPRAGEQDLTRRRFFGRLEAIQGTDLMWLSDGRVSVGAHVAGSKVHLLSSLAPEDEPQVLSWRRVYSLPAGTPVFIAGPLVREEGRRMFRARQREQLTIVIYDVEPHSIMRRAIRTARGRNEYWNQFTTLSVLTGTMFLLVYAFFLLRDPALRPAALLAMTLATAPIAPLLPPGVALFFAYRYLWQRGRLLRAERDLFQLPLRYFPGTVDQGLDLRDTLLPDGEPYGMRNAAATHIAGGQVASVAASAIIRRGVLRDRRAYVFGAIDPSQPEELRRPQDPLAELVQVEGHPLELSRLAGARARRATLLAAVAIGAALGVNLFGLLVLFSWLVP